MNEPRDPQLSGLYRDALAPEPAQRIDAAILAASRRAVRAGPRAAGIGFTRRWGTPVALAATVVVTFTLTLVVFEQQSGLDVVPPVAQMAAPRPDELAKISPAESKAPAPAPAAATPPAASRRDRAEQRPSESPTSGEPLGTGQPAFVPDVRRATEASRKREEARSAPPAAESGANLYSSERAGEDKPALSPRAQRTPELRQQTAPMQAPVAAPASGALRESISALQGAGVVSGISRSAAVADAKDRTPEKWLEDIRALKRQGKTADAERELAELKKRYPDYRLPEDLR